MFNCLACETMFPDKCHACMENIFVGEQDINDDIKLFEEFLQKNRINIATGDDFPLDLT